MTPPSSSSNGSSSLPPQNIEAEERVLGAILREPEFALPRARRILRPQDFYKRQHQIIFSTILATADANGGQIDPSVIVTELKKAGQWDAVGGPEYIYRLYDAQGTARTVEIQATYVAETAQLRSILQTTQAISERILRGDENSAQLLTDVRKAIAEAEENGARAGSCFLEMTDHEPGPDPEPIVERLLLPKTAGIVAAEPYGGKTTALDALAIAVSAGMPAFGQFHVPAPCPVIWVQMEDGYLRHHKRLTRLALGEGLPKIPKNLFRWSLPTFSLDDPRDMMSLRRGIETTKARLVLMDPFVYMHTRDENSNKEMADLLFPVKMLAAEMNCCIILIHHYSKPQVGAKGSIGNRVRGATAIWGWRDFAFFLSPRGPERLVEVEHKDLGAIKFFLRMEESDQGARIRYREWEPIDKRSEDGKNRLIEALLQHGPALADLQGWCKLSDIADRAGGMGRGTRMSYIDSLAEQGMIEVLKGEKKNSPVLIRLKRQPSATFGTPTNDIFQDHPPPVEDFGEYTPDPDEEEGEIPF